MSEPALFTPLRHADYRRLLGANTLSNIGGVIQLTAAAWMMAMITTSTNMVAWVQTSVTLPIMLFAILSGAISDNFSRRNVLLAAQIFMFLVSALLTLSAWMEWITPWQLLTFTFLVGCGAALNNPSWQASVGDLLPRAELPSGVLLNSIGFNISRSLAPAIGGMIVASAGATMAFGVNTVSYVFMIVALWLWKPEREERALPRENLGRAMLAGIRYIAMSPNIGKVLLRSFTFSFGSVALLALLPLIVRDQLHGSARDYGVMLGSFGLGGILGALCSKWLREKFSSETLTRVMFIAYALCALIAAFSNSRWAINAGMILGGTCWVATLTLFNTTVQLSTPRWVVGRALSIYMTLIFSGMSAGSWGWGQIAEHHGIQTALFFSCIALIGGAALGLLFAMPGHEAINLDPLNRWQAPALSLDIQPSSGPIIVMVEFIIAEKDVPEFLSAMQERRRIRLRDGAHNWTLMRDMQQPERWTMSYQLPTWVEYVRHHQRMTHADAHVTERINALHRGESPPVVRRLIERQTDLQAIKASQTDRPPAIPPAI